MRLLLGVLGAALLTGCGGPDMAEPQLADIMYMNGVIWTGETGAPDASVMALKDGKVTYAGTGKDVVIGAENVVDLQGRFIMPGFIDNHVHFLEGGASLASVDLRDAATKEEFVRRIGDYAGKLTDDRWILQGNWDHENWGGELPHRRWIDGVTGDRPVFIMRIDGHMALANSAALRAAGISKKTISPKGGEILRGEDDELSGIIKDNAFSLILDVIPKPSQAEYLEMLTLAQDHALSLGITKIHAVTAYPSETFMFDVFDNAHKNGKLYIRADVYTPIENWDEDIHKFTSAYASEHLRWRGVKGLVDGALGSTTAWFHEPYTHDNSKSGLSLIENDRFRAQMVEADAAGASLAIHAIGDKAIDHVIADMKTIGGDQIKSKRYRIEHFQHPSAKAIQEISDNGIIAAMHPYHAIDDGRWAEDRIGPQRIKTTYAFRSILDAGGILSFGSDWPVAPLSPMDGIYAAVTRRTLDGENPGGWQPQEKITTEEAMTAYTKTNAFVAGEENIAGTLTKGKRADFIVLSEDPRTIDPARLREIKVRATIIDGQVVYAGDPEP